MATKLSVALLFLFFTVAVARTLDLSTKDVTHLKLPTSLPESDPDTNLNHPIKENDDQQQPEIESTTTIHAVPLTLLRSRPINHRFRVRSRIPFRLCRHHFRHAQDLKSRAHLQIPYGNDMILSSGENSDFDPMMINFHHQYHHRHHHHHHDDERDDDEQKRNIPKFLRRDEHQDDDHEDDKIAAKRYEEEEADANKAHEKKNKMKKGGFMRGIRKFLHHYLD